MHYPDGDNIITDNDGASWFTDGPPATTLKADVMNALVGELANILKAYNIPIKNSGNDTYDQIAGALIARDQGKTREASVVIASSDSDENARLTADVVINANENFVPIINAQILALSNAGGGKILLRKGNYTNPDPFGTGVVTQNHVAIEGESQGETILSWTGALNSGRITATGKIYCSLSNLTIKVNVGGTEGIYGFNSNGCFCNNVTSEYTGAGDSGSGFTNCNNAYNCIALHRSAGFIDCDNLYNCVCENVGSNVGFRKCNNAVSCKAINCAEGFYGEVTTLSAAAFSKKSGPHINCIAQNCLRGFIYVLISKGCKAINCEQTGFFNCWGLQGCGAYSTWSGVGFRDCHGMQGNYGYSNISTFTSCTPEWTSAAVAIADTAAGGWNIFL